MSYNSTKDTLLHIKRVNELLINFSTELLRRGKVHDNSKFENPEKELFDKYTPMLKDTTYGSDEYKEHLSNLKPALDHHYKNNSHHPEHYENGIDDMNLYDIVEMFLDWKAATERHEDGDIIASIKINKERFGISDQLANIFRNTVKGLENSSNKEISLREKIIQELEELDKRIEILEYRRKYYGEDDYEKNLLLINNKQRLLINLLKGE